LDGRGQVEDEEHAQHNADGVEEDGALLAGQPRDDEVWLKTGLLKERKETNSTAPISRMLEPKLVPILPRENWMP
jgi:hypothetical protein